jgi:hypothetical protein
MQAPLPWERLLWRCRGVLHPGAQYVLTDFRLVCLNGRGSAEIAIQDVGGIHLRRSRADRLLGTSTLVVHRRDVRRSPLVLRHIRRGPELAALLELLAGLPQAPLESGRLRAALSWEPPTTAPATRRRMAIVAAALAAMVAIAASHRGTSARIVYPYSADDAIYPGGVKRSREEIVGFMETQVLPWARIALAPIKGGPDHVTCETCHGAEPDARGWRMPAVAALPEPHVKMLGWELYSGGMDAQLRNAVYGYLAESENQTKAAHMRRVVMPGMARLLNRPAYDFTKTYEYNRARMSFGCYHCHRVRQQD